MIFFLHLFFWYGLFFKKLNPSTDKLDSCCSKASVLRFIEFVTVLLLCHVLDFWP